MSDPRHIAIIMDGNGRWAKARGLPRSAGHRAGVEALRETVRGAGDRGLGYLTLFAFSSENWSRPSGEVGDLMGLLKLLSAAILPNCIVIMCACALLVSAKGWPQTFAACLAKRDL